MPLPSLQGGIHGGPPGAGWTAAETKGDLNGYKISVIPAPYAFIPPLGLNIHGNQGGCERLFGPWI